MKTPGALIAGIAALVLAGCAEPPDHAMYDFPLNSPGTKFSGLPPAVQNTVRAQAATAEIYDIHKSSAGDTTVYKVVFRNSEWYPPLFVAADGSVLNPTNLTVAVGAPEEPIGAVSGGPVSGVRPEDLPNKVMDTIRNKAPTAEINFIQKQRLGNNLVIYQISFKDGRPDMLVASDGSLVKKFP